MKYKSKTIEDYEDSAWARFLKRPGVKDPGTKDGDDTRCSLEPLRQ